MKRASLYSGRDKKKGGALFYIYDSTINKSLLVNTAQPVDRTNDCAQWGFKSSCRKLFTPPMLFATVKIFKRNSPRIDIPKS